MDQPAPDNSPSHAKQADSAARQGSAVPLFTFLFGGFVGLHLFWPNLMARALFSEPSDGPGGLNVALALGIAIILAATLLGMSDRQRRP